jgi:hypothetical protein
MSTPTEVASARGAEGAAEGDSDETTPLGAYATLAGFFVAAFSAASLALARRNRLPQRIPAGDLILIGIGTHKLSRLLSKDRVMSFLRAPFTEYEGKGGPGEVEEKARGRGLRRAVGELVTCPYCLGQWIGATFLLGLAAAPRLTRLVAATLSAVTISDTLQAAYQRSRRKRA